MPKSKQSKKKSRGIGNLSAVEDSHSRAEKLEALTQQAEAAIDAFNYDEAESKLQEILQIDSKNCKCLEMLSSVYIESSKWEEAQAILEQCIQLAPEVGYSKYFSIAQLCTGVESLKYYEDGIKVLLKEIENSENIEPSKEQNKSILSRNLSDAYCSISELFMTDLCFEDNAEERCSNAISSAVESDPSNPTSYQCRAQFQLVLGSEEEAKEAMQKSLSLWLPQLDLLREESEENVENKLQNPLPEYDSRISTSKLLIELKMFDEASKVLNGLLDEDDEVVEVWYLLGWLNYIRGEDEYKKNAHFYLKRAKLVSIKMGVEEDECIEHINELLEELSATHPISEDGNELFIDEEDNESASDNSYCSDSESDDMETQ